ncbi:MAG: response regulator [Spirochaetota bacterium]
MLLKTRYTLTMLVFGCLILGAGIAVMTTNTRSNKIREQAETGALIALRASELNYLSGNYMIFRESLQLEKWNAGYSKFKATLNALEPESESEKILVNNIQSNSRKLNEIFLETVANIAGAQSLRAAMQTSWSRVSVQTLSIVSDSTSLLNLLNEKSSGIAFIKTVYLLVFFGLICLFFIYNYSISLRRVIKSIDLLRSGAKAIGSGDLNHRIKGIKDDETGELAASFNKMATDLKAITISKSVLEKVIAGRRRVERELRATEERIQPLYDSMTEGVCLHDILYEDGKAVDYIITDCNISFEKITGLLREHSIGKRASELYGTGNPPYLDIYSSVASEGVPVHFETYFPPMEKHLNISVFSPEKGKFVTVFTDITERKKAEEEARKANDEIKQHAAELAMANKALTESRRAALNIMEDVVYAKDELQKLNETLEERVKERTALAESRAKQLQALAVELIEAEEQERRRVADILHEDLQQILAAARMHLDSVIRNSEPHPNLEKVGQLLEESIGKSRRLSHELSPAVLHHSNMKTVLEWLARQMEEQFGLEIMLEIEDGEPFNNMPLKVFLFRSAQELLFNISKHSGVKNARVAVKKFDNKISVTVSDEGKGFDMHILDPTARPKGYGLMSLRERASYIGGSLMIESTPGQGSTFTLIVPLNLEKNSELDYTNDKETAESPGGKPVPVKEILTVLFADDHQVIRQGLISLIDGQPDVAVVGEACNGEEALECVRKMHPNVVVMDVSMPVMNGIEATRRIKEEFPDVRVIGLSMYVEDEFAVSMKKAGAESFLSKTASAAELLKAIYGMRGVQ